MINSKCKICRRLGVKLFLKGEKCMSPKCAMIKKPYPPGLRGKKRVSPLSEFGKELQEKQKLKNWYNLSERQFRKYVKENPSPDPLIQKLELRADNVIFRLGFAASHAQARQLISHGHFLINGKRITTPSHQLKKGDKIGINPISQKKKIFESLPTVLKKHQPPIWFKLNIEKLEGEVTGLPTLEEVSPPAEMSAIFEYYSR